MRQKEKRMQIYNTLTRKKEEFVPIEPGKAKIYACGPTVYNYFHIGNARPLVVFDTLRKYLEYRGYEVTFVQNFTDVDDKIINKGYEEHMDAMDVARKFIDEYFDDARALNVTEASIHPKVSDHIEEIIDFISTLIDKGYAYEADGDVYFSTRKFSQYGKLSKQNIDDLEAGARIAIGEVKHDPLDFALWKARKKEEEIAWQSPWGLGRPGWHIECSAMAKKHLGETIDIHGGGEDLQFPHHENEIAQSECCNDKTFANYWMHNGYITIDNVKMSKSKGNFFTVRDIRKEYDGEVIRFFLLSGHYRGPINFSDMLMEQAKNGHGRMVNCKENLIHLKEHGVDAPMTDAEKENLEGLDEYRNQFIEAMDDDLNTADAISAIFQMVTDINTKVRDGATKEYAEKALAKLQELADVLGLLQQGNHKDDQLESQILALIEERQQARANKDFKRADEIRDILKAQGITLKDTPQGVQIVRD